MANMSIRSWPKVLGTINVIWSGFGKKKSTMSDQGVRPTKDNTLGLGCRLKVPNKTRDLDGDVAERAKTLCMSRAGYIGILTKIQREVEALMSSNGKLADVNNKLASYDRSWRDFVSTHE